MSTRGCGIGRRRVAPALLLALAGLTLSASSMAVADGAIAVRGTVLDAGGKPLRSATVELRAVEREIDAARRFLARGGEVPPRATATVDADGRFTLLAPESGFSVLTVRAAGRVAMQFALSPLLADIEVPELRMAAAVPLEVQVRDRFGKAVAGALVRARPDGVIDWDADDPRRWQAAERSAITGALGTVTLARRADEGLAVAVAAAGLAPTSAAEVRAAHLTLRLEEGSRRAIEVRGPQNEPLAGAVILDGGPGMRRGMPLAVTDARGRAEIPVASTGDTALRVLAEGAAPAETTLGSRTGADAAPGSALESRMQIRLAEPIRFGGRLLDADSRVALAGAFVWPFRRVAEGVRTDARGEFAIALAKPVALGAVATGHAEVVVREPAPGENRVVLLDSTRALSGRVLDAQRRAVAHAEVRLDFDGRPRQGPAIYAWAAPRPVVTGADGRFRLAGLVARAGYILTARHADFAPSTVEIPPLLERPPTELVVELRPGASARLRVLDVAGTPVGGAEARLILAPPTRGYVYRPPEAATGPLVAASDPRGIATWRHLAGGLYSIAITAPGFAPTEIPNTTVPERDAAEPVDLGSVRLARAEELHGIVVDPEGKPIAGASIWATRLDALYYARRRAPDAWSGADGSFRVGGFAPGDRIDLAANLEGYEDAESFRAEVPAQKPIRLVLRPSPALHVSGRVVDPAGKALTGVHVRLFPARVLTVDDDPRFSTTSDGEGHFTFGGVTAGTARLLAELAGWLPVQIETLDVLDGHDLERVEVVLRPGSVVAGTVSDGDGHALPDMQVWFGEHQPPPGMWSETSVFTDGDGRYLLSAVPSGPQTIHAAGVAGESARELVVEPGANTLDLKIARGVEISGNVTDAEGQPLAGASVRLLADSRLASFMGLHETTSAADGGFSLGGVRDGDYRLESDLEGYATTVLPAIVVHGAPVGGLALRLGRGATIHGALRGLSFRELAQVRVSAGFTGAPLGGRLGIVDADGSYRVAGAAAGRWRVTADLSSSGRDAHGEVTVPDGASEVTLDLEFPEPGVALSGRVMCGTSPLAQGSVSVTLEQGATPSVEPAKSGYANTNGDGSFRIEGLERGTYRMVVTGARLGAHTESVEVGDETFVEVEIPTGNLRGRIVDADDGTPLAGATVLLRSEEADAPPWGSREMTVTDAQGMFRVGGVAAGKWSASGALDGYTGARVPVEVPAGAEDAEVEIPLRRGSGLALDVIGPSGSVREAMVAVLGADGSLVSAGHFDGSETGRVRIPDVPAGSYDVLIAGIGTAPGRVLVTVPGPPTAVRLAPGCRLEVRVPALADGMIRATAQLIGADGQALRTPSWGRVRDSWRLFSGTAEIEGIPAGTWSVVVKAPDGRAWSTAVNAVPGRSQTVVLE